MKISRMLFLFLVLFRFNTSANTINTYQLAELCKVWGLVKFYNPNIVNGKISCDSLLIQALPLVKRAANNTEFNQSISLLLSKAGPVKLMKLLKKKRNDYDTTFSIVDFNWLRTSNLLNEENKSILLKTIDNFVPVSNQSFKNEFNVFKPYLDTTISYDSNVALLGLFRYWNYINYFYPHKNIIDENWDSVLVEFIPKVLAASNKRTYILCMAELTARINDSHASFTNYDFYVEIIGSGSPKFKVGYIEGKTVVTGIMDDSVSGGKPDLQVGDIILKINNDSTEVSRNYFRKYFGGSNPSSIERDVDKNLFRAVNPFTEFELTVLTKYDSIRRVKVKALVYQVYYLKYFRNYNTIKWKTLPGNLGYINLYTIKQRDVRKAFHELRNTQGIILDIRGYPQDEILHVLSRRLSSKNSLFVKLYFSDYSHPPGTFFGPLLAPYYRTQGYKPYPSFLVPKYKGHVVTLINENTQSHAEFTVMCFQAATSITTIGNNTAGADGGVQEIRLPYGIRTCFTGDLVLYPDGRQTQRIGIIPDIKVLPTIKGIQEGRDEVLEKAIEYLDSLKDSNQNK